LTQQFAGYALVVLFLLQIIIGILPDFNIIGLLSTWKPPPTPHTQYRTATAIR